MNDRALVAQMVAHMEGHLVEPISAEGLAAHAGYSINRLRQKFFHVTGDTPSGYLRKRRLTEAAKEILGGARLVDVGLKYGYSSQENFTTAFRSYFGITPSELARIQGKYKRFIRRMREAYSLMEIASLNQPPLNATLMGCMKGAADYFDLDLSAAMLYGLSGHAFLINIHRDLHPSSPYVWKKTHFRRLLAGVSIDTVEEFELSKSMPEPERRTIEERMKSRLNEGQLCMLDYLEHQLISGYDEAGFLTLRPWDGHAPSEVPQIAFGSWSPCLEREGWAHVTVLAGKRPPKPIESSLKDALAFAVELSSNPKDVEVEGYRIGAAAYDAWNGRRRARPGLQPRPLVERDGLVGVPRAGGNLLPGAGGNPG